MRGILLRSMMSVGVFWTFLMMAQGQDLKILSYNVMHGFEGDTARMSKYVEWLSKGIAPDIALYQEMNGFTQQKLRDLAVRYGHENSVILNNESGHDATHPLAITSRFPIEDVEMHLDSMWHGYIYAKIRGIHFFVTHMAPFTLKDRQRDVARIVAHALRLPKHSDVIIAGDFNSFSRSDAAEYDAELLASMRRIEGRLEPKSGTPIVKNRIIYRNNLNEGEFDYSVTDAVLNAGFKDALREKTGTFKNSVPVKANLKKNSKLRRIDYIWTSEELLKKVKEIDIIQDVYTDSLSDHYPILMTIRK